jgi:hypothetical protein
MRLKLELNLCLCSTRLATSQTKLTIPKVMWLGWNIFASQDLCSSDVQNTCANKGQA